MESFPCPEYEIDGHTIDEPRDLEDQLTTDEKERVLALDVDETATVGGGAFAEREIRRVQ